MNAQLKVRYTGSRAKRITTQLIVLLMVRDFSCFHVDRVHEADDMPSIPTIPSYTVRFRFKTTEQVELLQQDGCCVVLPNVRVREQHVDIVVVRIFVVVFPT